tara:strand:- start:664 stop:1734 length:1071 start_codon:yes stop_codon:yes gene_type:complete
MKNFFKNKKVIITGHTGFKGSWLALWLNYMGAKVMGISINYPTEPSNFKALKIENKINHKILDVRNYKEISKQIFKFKPDYLFHLAAEAIVQKSYQDPKKTWETNTLGTINILETLKNYKKNIIAIIITSDKVYKNTETSKGYKENDRLGSFDPYSASKASADLAVQSYIESFFKKKKNIRIAIARAGNVIGGGDWSTGRLIPDCVRQWSKNKTVVLSNPKSTRPWQHVLDILRGYILLAISLKKNKSFNGEIFNFGPKKEKNVKEFQVINIVKKMKDSWKKAKWKVKKNRNFFESKLLQLDSKKANKKLNWQCLLNLKQSIHFTLDWYKTYYKRSQNIFEFSINQIKQYEKITKQ